MMTIPDGVTIEMLRKRIELARAARDAECEDKLVGVYIGLGEQLVWLDRVQIDHSIDAHDIDVIRALCEVCEPPLTVARLFELLEREQDETVRRGLVEVIRQRAARGEGREVAECYVRLMLQQGARTLTAERVAEAVGVSLRVAGEVLMEYARGVVRTRVSGRRVTVYRLQPAEGGQVSVNPVQVGDSACGQVSVNPVHWEDSACGQVSVNPVQVGDSACGQVSCEPVQPVQEGDSAGGQVSVNPVQPSGQVSCEPVQVEDSAVGAGGCDHNLLEVVSALQATPKLLVHTAARLVSNYRDVPMCAACDEIRRMLVLVRDEASAAACGARARGLLAQVGEVSPGETMEQYRLDGTYTEKELGWIPHILEIIEASGRIMPFYAALKVRRRLNLSQKETEAVQELIWRMARSGDAGLRVVGGSMVERVPIVCGDAAG
jgi:hypothetical protein